ncbi:MAG: DUF1592 domain-containing protein [Planctomycetaceae bacterium]
MTGDLGVACAPSSDRSEIRRDYPHRSGRALQRCLRVLAERPDDLRYILVLMFFVVPVAADELDRTRIAPLLEASCIGCHDENTDTRLDLTSLSNDLSSVDTFRTWEKIFDRVDRGEMPPQSEPKPDQQQRNATLNSLRTQLHAASLNKQITAGRVPSRRLSRAEYEHTLHDLLGIGGSLARYLPPENESGSFDVIAAKQDMSSVHVRGFLTAANHALDEAIQLGPKPNMKPRMLDYFNSKYFNMWIDRPVRRGGGTVFKTDKDIVTFRGANYVLRSDVNGFRPPVAGRYRITVKGAAHQPHSSVTMSLKRQNDAQGESELFAAWDVGRKFREVETIKYLRPDDYIYASADELDPSPDGKTIYGSQPASEFRGEGVKVRRVMIEGPLESDWPPMRTRNLMSGVEWKWIPGKSHDWRKYRDRAEARDDLGYAPAQDAPAELAHTVISNFATRAFLRKVTNEEVEALIALGKPLLEENNQFVPFVRVPLRTILVSPEFVFLSGEPGPLHGADLARRLSYFLWRSMPDDELLQLGTDGKLADEKTLISQVDRMLTSPKADRFVHEFLGQWLDLDRIDATTPDTYLYPEYDDVLRAAMLAETREFFAHLIDENLPASNLIDSDFTFLNRRLAEHYNIDDVKGERVRKVQLEPGSVRGGILTHASIAKVTANGTVTTPVKRGSFVLTKLLGTPPNPPPPGVGAIEPDTRAATTIRETLEKHKSIETCASCHHQIDPPGFAMESFDPVGIFRTRYRNSKGVRRTAPPGLRFARKDYTLGRPVDASGTTADGTKFKGIRDYKATLMKSKEQVARNVLSQLIAFSTGAEIQFGEREEVERILRETKADGFPLRSLIHQVVTSRMFKNR